MHRSHALAALAALGLSASCAQAQLLVGVDDATVPIRLYEMNGATPVGAPQSFNIGNQAWGMAADDPGRVLYVNNGASLYSYKYEDLSAPQLTVSINDAGTTRSMVGLAFSNFNNKLYAVNNIAPEGLWEVDPNTGAAQLVVDYVDGDYDFGGIDYDPATNTILATNDDTSPFGSGLFRISLTGTITKVANYPAGETDIDGLAVGNGRAFLVEDDVSTTGNIYPYNLATNSYEAAFPTPWAANEIFSAGAWAPGLIPEPGSIALLAASAAFLLRRRA